MPTPMDYARAAAKAAAAGDMEAAQLFRSKSAAGYQAEVPSVTDDMGTTERVRAGIGQGMSNVGRHIGRLTGQVSKEDMANARETDRDLLSTTGGKVGSFIGEVAATAPVGGLAGAGAKTAAARLGMGGVGRALATTAGMGATQGAAEGALMADEGERGTGALIGATLGAAVPVIGGKIAKSVSRGVAPTKAARRLLNEGVDLTPGQMNPRGSYNQIEEAAKSLPIVGPIINNARAEGMGQWQKQAFKKGAAPGAVAEDITEAYASYGPAYGGSKGFPMLPKVMQTQGGDIPLTTLVTRSARDPNVLADTRTRRSVGAWLDNQMTKLPGKGTGQTTSDDLLSVRSKIRDEIRQARSGAQPDASRANLLENAENAISRTLESQLPPDVWKALNATDAKYGSYKVLEDAMRRAGDQLEGMTPSKLGAAVKAATPGSSYGRGGGGPLRQWAKAGREVFEQRQPPTGARLATLGGLGYMLGAGPATALAGLGTAAATTKAGRKALAGSTAAQRQMQAFARALRRNTTKAGRVALPAAAGAAGGRQFFEDQE